MLYLFRAAIMEDPAGKNWGSLMGFTKGKAITFTILNDWNSLILAFSHVTLASSPPWQLAHDLPTRRSSTLGGRYSLILNTGSYKHVKINVFLLSSEPPTHLSNQRFISERYVRLICRLKPVQSLTFHQLKIEIQFSLWLVKYDVCSEKSGWPSCPRMCFN